MAGKSTLPAAFRVVFNPPATHPTTKTLAPAAGPEARQSLIHATSQSDSNLARAKIPEFKTQPTCRLTAWKELRFADSRISLVAFEK